MSIPLFRVTMPGKRSVESMGVCYIVGAGDFTKRGLEPREGDLLIAADGGYAPLRALGWKPKLLLGDLDSLGGAPKELPPETELKRYPEEKDDTDTGLALREGWERGYRRFALYGCGGGRADHLLANLQTMGRYAAMGAEIRLTDPEYDVFALHNGALELPPRPPRTIVSVFCHGERATGVTLQGLQYPLNKATLTCDFPLGVSNRYVRERPLVSVDEGTLLILAYREKR